MAGLAGDIASSGPPAASSYVQTKADLAYRRRVIGREHGSPDTRILSLLQTRDGSLWGGTRKRLARFDGLNAVILNQRTCPVFPSDECTAPAENPEGALWVGTTAGLVQLTASGEQRWTTREGLAADRILNLCAARNRDLWGGTDCGAVGSRLSPCLSATNRRSARFGQSTRT